MRMRVSVSTCMWMCVSVLVDRWVYECVCMSVRVCVGVSVCMCECVCACECVCVFS